jgi:putative membrane protein
MSFALDKRSAATKRRLASSFSIRKAALLLVVAFYMFLWAGGVGSHILLGETPAGAAWAAPVFLLLAGAIIALGTKAAAFARLLAAAMLGFAAEVLGVAYGFIFGGYVYTDALAPRLFEVPLVMISAWAVLLAYVVEMLRSFDLPAWARIVTASAWMTSIDLVIDPLAANQLGYWRWMEAGPYYGVPLHNFAGWFAVSLAAFALLRLMRGDVLPPGAWSRRVGLSIILFFTAMSFVYTLVLPAVFGILLTALHVVVSFIRKSD